MAHTSTVDAFVVLMVSEGSSLEELYTSSDKRLE